MWIAFRFDGGDFLLPSSKQGRSSAGTKSSTYGVWQLAAVPSISKWMDPLKMVKLFKCLNLLMTLDLCHAEERSSFRSISDTENRDPSVAKNTLPQGDTIFISRQKGNNV
jgi:hypothetical protein